LYQRQMVFFAGLVMSVIILILRDHSSGLVSHWPVRDGAVNLSAT
jgi:hypothetical protein